VIVRQTGDISEGEVRSMKVNPRGFTLIELLVVITIIGILAAIALPNYIKAKDKAKEVEAKANLHTIQIAVERYNTDHKEYPAYLLGGDSDGWLYWHDAWDEDSPPPEEPANAWVQDPLVEYNYIVSYPENPFIDAGDGGLIIDATAPFMDDPEQGDGDPRFGYKGNIMGCGLDDPKFFEYGLHTASPRIETRRTLDRGDEWEPTEFGFPDRNASQDSFPGLYYNFGGRYNHINRKTIYTYWPGNFFYQSASDIQPARSGFTWPYANRWYRGHVLRYMLGVYGSQRTPGKDVIRLQEVTPDDLATQLWWRYPPPFPDPPESGTPRVATRYAISAESGGLPAVFGGGSHSLGPAYPADRDPKYLGQFIYGAPDGVKDGIILVLYTGQERDEIQD
jgi:prepilin-type N-terminal cleavage/methylation domain-containing protein